MREDGKQYSQDFATMRCLYDELNRHFGLCVLVRASI